MQMLGRHAEDMAEFVEDNATARALGIPDARKVERAFGPLIFAAPEGDWNAACVLLEVHVIAKDPRPLVRDVEDGLPSNDPCRRATSSRA